MDALSDLLRAVRLTGGVFFDVQAGGSWVAESPQGRQIVHDIFPTAEHLISYHVVTEGGCYGHMLNEAPRRLEAGDVIVFPQGDAHVMASGPGMRGTPDLEEYRRLRGQPMPFSMTMGDGGDSPSHVICGFLGCDARPFNPLLAALPPVIHLTAAELSAKRGGEDSALATLVKFAVAESSSRRAGGEAVLGRLSELMFVDVVRRYIESLPEGRTDWLSALREPFVGRALTALHASPARDWTLEALAREVGLSRSALAERFTAFVGQPPMQYLANWRMQLAAAELQNGNENLAGIAERVGYESEAAFSRAFKKAVGVAPGQWRKQKTAPAPGAGAASVPA